MNPFGWSTFVTATPASVVDEDCYEVNDTKNIRSRFETTKRNNLLCLALIRVVI
jgi:hypothetical protein